MEDLTLHLGLESKGESTDRLPEATVVLTNEGSSLLLVNARLLLVPEGGPEEHGEINFSIEGPPESFSMKTFRVNSGRPKPENFVKLMPGESLVRSYDLGKYFHYEDPGSYKIIATYRNVTDINVGGTNSWKGSLVSNAAQFEIQK